MKLPIPRLCGIGEMFSKIKTVNLDSAQVLSESALQRDSTILNKILQLTRKSEIINYSLRREMNPNSKSKYFNTVHFIPLLNV